MWRRRVRVCGVAQACRTACMAAAALSQRAKSTSSSCTSTSSTTAAAAANSTHAAARRAPSATSPLRRRRRRSVSSSSTHTTTTTTAAAAAAARSRACDVRKHTTGVCVDVSYFPGNGAARWVQHFAQTYLQRGLSTAPQHVCPFCFAAAARARRTRTSSSTDDATTASQSRAHAQAAWLTLRAPCAMVRHMSWCHAHQGYTPEELHAYNAHVTEALLSRLRHCDVAMHTAAAAEATAAAAQPPPFRLLLLLDVANVELGVSDLMLALLQSTEAQRLLSAVPVAVCCVCELFLPHTAKTLHAAYQLAQLHPHSDMYTLYSVSRLEAGDLACAALVGALRLRAPRDCPPVVLLTMDSQQRACMVDLYGTASLTASPFGAVHAMRLSGVPTLLRKMAAAIEYGMYAV